MERWIEKENRKYLRAGTVAAAAINPHLDLKKTTPLTPFDIFPHLPPPVPILPTPKEAAANMLSFFEGIERARERRAKRRRKA